MQSQAFSFRSTQAFIDFSLFLIRISPLKLEMAGHYSYSKVTPLRKGFFTNISSIYELIFLFFYFNSHEEKTKILFHRTNLWINFQWPGKEAYCYAMFFLIISSVQEEFIENGCRTFLENETRHYQEITTEGNDARLGQIYRI